MDMHATRANIEFLYHGSIAQGLRALEPRKRYTPDGKIDFAAVYASPNPVFAIMHSFPWSSDEGFDIAMDDNQITLIVPADKSSRLDVPISLYRIAADGFEITREEVSGQTWHATQPVNVLEETKFNNVKDALVKYGATTRLV